MSTTAPAATAPSRKHSPSTVALWILGLAVLAAAPGLVAGVVTAATWALTQLWIVGPALLLAAAWHRWPGHTKRAFLVGAALAHQQVTQRRQPKTA